MQTGKKYKSVSASKGKDVAKISLSPQAPWATCHWTLFSLIFFVHFSTQLLFTFLTLPFSPIIFLLCFFSSYFHAHDRRQEHIRLVLVTEQLVYWTTDIPKQSCCGSSSPRSCAGTSSATTEHSHHSKFWTSQTRSMSRSASTA